MVEHLIISLSTNSQRITVDSVSRTTVTMIVRLLYSHATFLIIATDALVCLRIANILASVKKW